MKARKIITITFAEMCVYAHVASSACEAFVFAIGNVLFRFGIDVFLRQTIVDNVDGGLLRRADSAN